MNKKIKKQDWLKIPNLLSYFRVLLIPFFVHSYLIAQDWNGHLIAAGILFLSGVTDAIDGIIARRFNQVSDLGKLIDPVADKLTQVAVAAVLIVNWPIMAYLLVLFIFKEFSLFIINLLLLKKGQVIDGAMWFGKIGTIVFYCCMFILVISPSIDSTLLMVLILTTAFFQLAALVGYLSVFFNLYKEPNV